jgi:hypothetical protein
MFLMFLGAVHMHVPAVVQVGLPEMPAGWHQSTAAGTAAAAAAAGVASGAAALGTSHPEVLGWEANSEGRLKAR